MRVIAKTLDGKYLCEADWQELRMLGVPEISQYSTGDLKLGSIINLKTLAEQVRRINGADQSLKMAQAHLREVADTLEAKRLIIHAAPDEPEKK